MSSDSNLRESERSLVDTLLYFDIFDHPLKHDELQSYAVGNGSEFSNALHSLQKKEIISQQDGYLCLQGKDWTIGKRQEERKRVNKYLRIARLLALLMAIFPFVRGVFISGSLSKMRAGKKSDIDYFIVTSPGRLWVARTFLILFKKIFLFNSYRYFCLNYFLDSESLEITTKNRYAATEIVTLIPVYNYQLFRDFYAANQWIREYYPMSVPHGDQLVVHSAQWVQKIFEWLLRNKVGDQLDDYFMRKTLEHRKKKFRHMTPEEFQKAFCTEKNCSRHHPVNFQSIVDQELKIKKEEVEWRFGTQL
jgi:hypothetical protein